MSLVASKLKAKKQGEWWKILLFTFLIIIVLCLAALILFISPLTKYIVEKYAIKYTGREIKMDDAHVNLFKGSIQFTNLKIYEQKGDSIFFSAKELSADISLFKLFSKTCQVNSLTLDQPRGIIVQNNEHFNFSDLIRRFTPEKKRDSTKASFRFNILNVTINDGEFFYAEQLIPINYSIREVNFKSAGKYWNQDTINVKFSFLPGIGSGDAAGDIMFNLKTLDYRLATVTHKFDLSIIGQYLKDITNYSNFSANIDMDLYTKGNINNTANIDMKGKMAINDLHVGKSKSDDYASFEKVSVGIKELDSKNKKYFFDSVILTHPYFKLERYDSLDNIDRMFILKGTNMNSANDNSGRFNLIIEVTRYLQIIFREFLKSDYNINSIAIKAGVFQFNDYAINEKFSAALNPISIKADSVDSKKNWVKGFLNSGIKPYGSVTAAVSMNPKNDKDFKLTYKLQNVPAASANPYLISFTSFPLDRGVIEISGDWQVRNDIIQSTNHFIVFDPRLTEPIRKKDTRRMPMPLIMSLILERGNIIDYQIPVTGNMKNPKFHLNEVIKDAIGNIFFKASSRQYKMKVINFDKKTEKSLSLIWAMRQTNLSGKEEAFVNKLAVFLKENPEAKIIVHPFYYAVKEKEYILFFEAKKKYFLARSKKRQSAMTEKDSLSIDKMNPKDPAFVKYLDNYARDTMLFTMQDKCNRLVDIVSVNRKFNQLVKTREQLFVKYFKENQTDKQVEIFKYKNTVPFNGFSYFKIDYKGNIPDSLMAAYNKLIELYDEPARVKYLQFQKGNVDSLKQKKIP
jgi:hypothetical protein